MAIIGAILGDIAGSQYEYDRPADLDYQNCELFTEECEFTDDTVMSLAIKKAIDEKKPYQEVMREVGRNYPVCGYGNTFFDWVFCDNPRPYNSFGNGSAMRVSYIGETAETLEGAEKEAERSAMVSHNHPEGMKGAAVTAGCVWLAKDKRTKDDIYKYVLKYYPPEDYKFSGVPLEKLRETYSWDVTCMTSVPVALRCFYESDSYISFIRNVFSLDCDCDTLCAIGGGVAEEYYGKTGLKNDKILKHYLSDELYEILFPGKKRRETFTWK
ncbi:MAG: ADP-ribosylglycohydrolase family protein [Lachnospiraceae bacterium]|nr:ADP-ribosylglycohydrolase family protein [Lachnospiraceae bacterium]